MCTGKSFRVSATVSAALDPTGEDETIDGKQASQFDRRQNAITRDVDITVGRIADRIRFAPVTFAVRKIEENNYDYLDI